MEHSRIDWLAQQVIRGLANNKEQEEFFAWIREQKDDAIIHQLMQEQWNGFETFATLPREKNEQLFQSVLYASKLLKEDESTIIRPFFNWKRWASVAAVFLMLLTGGYFLLLRKPGKQNEIVKVQEPAKDVKAPAANRAIITLADRRVVYLDS